MTAALDAFSSAQLVDALRQRRNVIVTTFTVEDLYLYIANDADEDPRLKNMNDDQLREVANKVFTQIKESVQNDLDMTLQIAVDDAVGESKDSSWEIRAYR